MKTTKLSIAFLLLILASISYSQVAPVKMDTLSKGTINEQFNFVIRKSSNFKQYKVVKSYWLNKLKKHVADTIQLKNKTILDANNKIQQLNAKIDNLNTKIEDSNKMLSSVNEEKDSIRFFGNNISKANYKLMMWSLVTALFLALLYFIFSFKKSNEITKTSVSKLEEVEKDFSAYRGRALEREQALNRKLLDEINKHKNAN